MSKKITEPYTADDRGNVVDFYDAESGAQVGRINREAEVNGVPDQSTWEGDNNLRQWAVTHGYPEAAILPVAP